MSDYSSIPKESFELIKRAGEFEIAPCDGYFDFEDKTRFKQVDMNSAQKMHISALIQQIPGVVASDTLSKAYSVSFPKGLPHTLTALKQGGFGSMLRENGKFAGTASFYELGTQGAIMGAFSAMSIATGQYFLTQINSELTMMNLKIDRILEFLYGDKKAELMSELSFAKYAYQNFSSIMSHVEQRVATIISLQESKKVAMKDIEFYMGDLDYTVNQDAKNYASFDLLANKAFQIRESLEFSLQLYTMSSLLEVYYAQNHDHDYMQYLESDMSLYIDKCEKRILTSFSILNRRFGEYKANPIEKLGKIEKTAHENRMSALIESLNSGEESAMRKSLRTALHASRQKAEYYLSNDGSLYTKVH